MIHGVVAHISYALPQPGPSSKMHAPCFKSGFGVCIFPFLKELKVCSCNSLISL